MRRDITTKSLMNVSNARKISARTTGSVSKRAGAWHLQPSIGDGATNPLVPRVLFNMGQEHRELGNYDKMRAVLERLVANHQGTLRRKPCSFG